MNLECFKDRYSEQTVAYVKGIIQTKYQDRRFYHREQDYSDQEADDILRKIDRRTRSRKVANTSQDYYQFKRSKSYAQLVEYVFVKPQHKRENISDLRPLVKCQSCQRNYNKNGSGKSAATQRRPINTPILSKQSGPSFRI